MDNHSNDVTCIHLTEYQFHLVGVEEQIYLVEAEEVGVLYL
jgi:hypothetical protein